MGRTLAAVLGAAILLTTTAVYGQLFETDSKRLAGSQMDIVVTEIARRAKSSVIEVTINSRGSAVGGSMFIICSLRQLAELRGGYRHIIKVDNQPRRGQMIVGFLTDPDEDPHQIDPDLRRLGPDDGVIDLNQFAEVCKVMK